MSTSLACPRSRSVITAGLAAAAGLLILALGGCHRPLPAETARAQVMAALAVYDTLILHMDADRIAASFTPDGESADGDQAPLHGPEAIRQHLLGFAAFHVLANRLVADTTWVQADTARQEGSYWQRVQLPAGDTVEASGRFSVTWRRSAAGAWQIFRMHTHRPPPA